MPNAHLGFAAYGELNEAKDNVIVYPTWYTGLHHNNGAFIGSGKALDPSKYFIVVPDMFTNGLSTSPSNCSPPFDGDVDCCVEYCLREIQGRRGAFHAG